jgi:hypothetical protein
MSLKTRTTCREIDISLSEGLTIIGLNRILRVNSSSNSSKTIVPRKIIEGLNLRYDDDYLEWRMEMRGGRKVATVRKFKRRSE